MQLTVVDAFTDRPFSGNPAAVALLDAFPAAERMQQVAAEMNLSETAFAVPREGGGHDLRWFTPSTEVDLCGHATLATAHALGSSTEFHTRSGTLAVGLEAGWISMDFPAWPPSEAVLPAVPEGLPPTAWTGTAGSDWLVEVATASMVSALVPDLATIAALGRRALVVTARADPGSGADFVSRVFAPNVGVAEDPVTGSAHCALAPYWAERLGRRELVGYQASARGGTVRATLAGDRVVLSGRAVTVSEVRLLV